MSAALWLQAREVRQETETGSKSNVTLLEKDLKEKPWATHSQRREFLFAICGVRVSEATVCRALKRLSHSRKKDPEQPHKEMSS